MTEPLPPLAPSGEELVPKRCAYCGVAPTVLAWRPLEPARVSSPMSQPAWMPMDVVVDAKVSCRSCRSTAYGWLAGGRTGTFIALAGPLGTLQLEAW